MSSRSHEGMLWALPNVLTLLRLPLAGLLWVRAGETRWMLSIIALAAITDIADGRLARSLRRRLAAARRADGDDTGAWLDPLCDKIFAASALAALWFGASAPLLFIGLALSRELLIAPLVVGYHLMPGVRRSRRFDFHANWLGKLTTALQFAFVTSFLLYAPAAGPLAIAAAFSGVLAATHYVLRGLRAPRAADAVPRPRPRPRPAVRS